MRINTPKLLPLLFLLTLAFASCKKERVTAVERVLTDTASKKTSTTGTANNNQVTGSTTITTEQKISADCCKTQNVIIVVIDGPRFSETWGDYTKQNIPNRYNLYGRGVLLGNFRNNGATFTNSGHGAICTGNYELLENSGQEIPQYPSIFQNFLKSTGKPAEKAWVVTSKDKLQILADCKQPGWAGKYMPKTDCGRNGLFSGYREDDSTMVHTGNIMKTYHPNLMLINFKDPDYFAHAGYWDKYVAAIKSTDAYIKDIYELIQGDENYRDKTTLIVTNDHGRHTNGFYSGFSDHGCDCDGCRQIEFFAVGPDFKKGLAVNKAYEQIDISATVARLLNFKMDYGKGKVITDIFN